MTLVQRLNAVMNAAVRPLVASPRGGRLVGRWMTVITYTGRRSGRSFSIPVGYAGRGDDLTIAVGLPDQKRWWRNFLGAGAPISVRLNGLDRAGHAVVNRDASGRVTVAVRLVPVDQ
jgi:F420H(2)-dependent quinone reductase